MWNSFDMISSSGHKKRGLLLFPSATPYMETYSATWMFPKNSSEITLQSQHNQQEYNRYYRRLWFMNLSRTLIFQSNSMQPHQQTTSQSHKSFFQFFLICNFFFFAEVLWGFILPPAVSLSRILWELAFLLRKEPPLRIAKKSLIVSWWSWWESHPCLKSYWTTSRSPYGEPRFGYI